MTIWILSLAAFLVIAAGSSSSSEDDKFQDVFDQGMKYLKSEKYGKAVKSFKKALKINSKDADALNQLAYSQRKNGQIDEAIANYHKALKIRPQFPQAREYLGEAYLQAALAELEQLKKYGSKAKHEYDDLKEAILDLPSQIK
ncbi:UDP-N-acetylglucosamine--peptide N-acetylglucosaminyltransferase 110 kDa subunit-like [Ylistrum balloti]|uniref:UDP-N-acetylglucosamine--peptide N-acetylglucosaminyltransferase 110 kDa subunit-like n=1 Tax=Ylistrum balloti TaxID=509963 RepID=UPI002905BBD8|nr:UDP-N-acetylglucosamine--peptide N-acetylglucosaminyltransferase 110 kDa subunit-like [Ylistrum balloti]